MPHRISALDRIVPKDANHLHRVKSVEFVSSEDNANQDQPGKTGLKLSLTLFICKAGLPVVQGQENNAGKKAHRTKCIGSEV